MARTATEACASDAFQKNDRKVHLDDEGYAMIQHVMENTYW